MKYLSIGLVSLIMFLSQAAFAQPDFHGVKATKSAYHVAYQLNTDDEAKIKATLKNIQNALDDPRLKGKLEVELVVHGGGVAALKKGSPFEQTLLDLQKQGVVLAQCENTLRERKISKDEMLPFIGYTPSGNGELIIRQQQGWAIMHP
ncbi:DsrE family protein [Spirosoma sp.]|uniref:DsrE family protein n=1 Tax=Spirosoma sp. TaxID=1899569 RepID=UPI00262E0CA5|nr:DsrE family protein [Spirosoma sp.]MCX6216776.1 DsrE family protein [Spirosoma sp.]